MDDDGNHPESYELILDEIVKFYEGLIGVAGNSGKGVSIQMLQGWQYGLKQEMVRFSGGN